MNAEAYFLYFAYGSNMSSRRLTAPGRAPSAVPLSAGYVSGRRLTFDKFSVRDGSGKCDCEATGNLDDRVYGVVYRIAAADRASLDAAEGLHHGYRDDLLPVVTPAGTLVALAYVATDKRPRLPVLDWYLEHVLAGAAEHGLPAAYVAQLREIPTVSDDDHVRAAAQRAIYR